VTGFMNRAQVAAWLGVTLQKFMQMREGELAALNFPAPAFGTRQGERWDPETLQAWRRSLMPEALRALAAVPAAAEDEIADELDRRAAALGRQEKVH
jgi:hypothetical protein